MAKYIESRITLRMTTIMRPERALCHSEVCHN
jgi:hypothetical protein